MNLIAHAFGNLGVKDQIEQNRRQTIDFSISASEQLVTLYLHVFLQFERELYENPILPELVHTNRFVVHCTKFDQNLKYRCALVKHYMIIIFVR